MKNKNSSDFIIKEDNEKIYIRLYFDITNSSNIKDVMILEIIDDKKIMINENLANDIKKVFLYGQQINDFYNLDKSAIYTIAVSAIKQLDTEILFIKKSLNYLLEKDKNDKKNKK